MPCSCTSISPATRTWLSACRRCSTSICPQFTAYTISSVLAPLATSTLSRFLRDYLYIPLGGTVTGACAACQPDGNHAAGRFVARCRMELVIWGGLHGAYLACNTPGKVSCQGAETRSRRHTVAGRAAGIVLTFLAVVLAWVFFRATSLPAALNILQGMQGCTVSSAGTMASGPCDRRAATVANVVRVSGAFAARGRWSGWSRCSRLHGARQFAANSSAGSGRASLRAPARMSRSRAPGACWVRCRLLISFFGHGSRIARCLRVHLLQLLSACGPCAAGGAVLRGGGNHAGCIGARVAPAAGDVGCIKPSRSDLGRSIAFRLIWPYTVSTTWSLRNAGTADEQLRPPGPPSTTSQRATRHRGGHSYIKSQRTTTTIPCRDTWEHAAGERGRSMAWAFRECR